MATDYDQITRENIGRYGTAIDEYGPLLLADRYSDRTHFVYELLQNAEDALGWRLECEPGFPKDVSFELLEDGLVFRHYGLPFSEEHVRGICNIGKGTKAEDLTAIGKHGIGFKSVYAYTHHPEVHSGDEHFVIDLFVRPRGIGPRPTTIGETCFWLPLDHPEVQRADAHAEIAARLKKLGLKTLLFLRNIESISWALNATAKGHYLRDRKKGIAEGVDKVTLLGQEDDEEPLMEEWLVFNKRAEHDGRPAGFLEVAFALETDKDAGTQRVRPVSESPLVVFFPTERETHFGFLIQGPYRTTPSRDNIPKSDPWNQQLVLATADLTTEALRKLRDMGLLDVSALETVAINPSRYASESQAAMFRPVLEAILKALKTERLIPVSNGNHVAGKDARLSRADRIRTLVSAGQLQAITASESPVEWVTGDITSDRTPNLHRFLIAQLGIKEMDSEDFLRAISGEFLTKQSDSWLIQFYGFLHEVPALTKRPWFREKPFVRLEDGTQIPPFTRTGMPNAYLPVASTTGFPTVRRSVCLDENAREFLTDMGLKEPDLVDDVIQNILPRYRLASSEISSQYEQDISRIVSAYQTDSASRKGQLIEGLRGATWVLCQNTQTGQTLLKAPGSAHLPTQKLQELFQGNPRIWFVDRKVSALQGKQCQAVLEASGVSEHLKRETVRCELSSEELQDIRRKAGLERHSWGEPSDYTINGLRETLERFPCSTLAESDKLSLTLWECLHDALRENGEGFFYGEYKWRYSHESKTARFPASFVRLLQSAPWLLVDNELKSPSQVCFRQLPEAFQENANHILIELLQFKPDEIRQLAEKTGIEEETLNLLRQLNLCSAEELKKRLGLLEMAAPSGQHAKKPKLDVTHEGDTNAAIGSILGDGHDGPKPPSNGNQTGEYAGGGTETQQGNGGTKERDQQSSTVGGSPRTEYHTYVSVRGDAAPHEQGETREQRLQLENMAIEMICQEDSGQFAEIRRMSQGHMGYDLEAIDATGEVVRYIEVKALRCAWEERPATLSEPQFGTAQRKGDRFWLYVVAKTGQPDAKIYRIHDPASQTKYFTFDHGWRALSDETREAHGQGDQE